MDIKNIYGKVVYSAPDALTIGAAVRAANKAGVQLNYCEFGPSCKFGESCEFGWSCKFGGSCEFGESCKFGGGSCEFGWSCKFGESCEFGGKPVKMIRSYTGLYRFVVSAVLFADGSRWVRMGCLFKSLEEWEKVGVRKSNLVEYPDDGSERSEERVAAFEFAKAAALRMK